MQVCWDTPHSPLSTIRSMTPTLAIWPPQSASTPFAVLVSGGLDSAVLLGEAVRSYPAVYPLYIRTGLAWESVELAYLQRFLKAISAPALHPLQILEQPVRDLYGEHWSITGRDVPDADTPDEAVFLPGRNVLLLAKALLWCHLRGIPELAMAPLEANPFPDATPEFFAAFAGAIDVAVAGKVCVLTPYANLSKLDVLKRGRFLPLGETFSCIQPMDNKHCGRCNKCAERRKAFIVAGITDPTQYHQ